MARQVNQAAILTFSFASRRLFLLLLWWLTCAWIEGGRAQIGDDDYPIAAEVRRFSIPKVIPLGSVKKERRANRNRIKCINNLADEYRRLIGRHIRGKNPVLVDTVDHANIGDNIIQFGEIKLLEEFGIQLREACSNWDCNLTRVAERVDAYDGESVILIHGGGNLGDIWRSNMKFRFRVVRQFPNTPIVLLPQSVFYMNEKNALDEAELYRSHKDVTIYLRDTTSLNYIRSHFSGMPSYLCPDSAFMAGPLSTEECKPVYDVFFLTRKDAEKRKDIGSLDDALEALKSVNLTVAQGDWWDWKKWFPNYRKTPTQRLAWAEWRLRLGADFLCLGRVIVTDRLHATLLSTLLGLPHIYVDNFYRKISTFADSNFRTREECSQQSLRGWNSSSWMHAAHIAAAMYRKTLD